MWRKFGFFDKSIVNDEKGVKFFQVSYLPLNALQKDLFYFSYVQITYYLF